MERMELMMVEQLKVWVFEKDSAQIFPFFFPCMENGLTRFTVFKESWKKAHIEIDPMGRLLFNGTDISSSN